MSLRIRTGTSEEWNSITFKNNLKKGEPVFTTDTGQLFVGKQDDSGQFTEFPNTEAMITGLAGKVDKQEGYTLVSREQANKLAYINPASAAPAQDGTAAAGTSLDYARADHVHPTDSSKANTGVIAPEYQSSNKTYNTGDICYHNNNIYVAKEDGISGDWDGNKWDPTTVSKQLNNASKFSDTNKVVITDATGKETTSTVSATELGYLSGATSNIQTQLGSKASASALADEITNRSDADTLLNTRLNNLINSTNITDMEKVLWTGSAMSIGDPITLSDPVTDFDYIDVYAAAVSGYIQIHTFSSDDFLDDKVYLDVVGMDSTDSQVPKGLMASKILIKCINNSPKNFEITASDYWEWSGIKTDDATIDGTLSLIYVYKVVGRKTVINEEVKDIRVGYDRTEYASAGDAVRGQISGLKDALDEKISTFTDVSFELSNTRILSNGNYDSFSNAYATNKRPCEEGQTVKWFGTSFWYDNSPAMLCLAFYDGDGNLLSGINQIDGSTATTNQKGTITTTVPSGAKYVAGSDRSVGTATPYLHLYDVEENIDAIPTLIASNAEKLDKFNDVAFSNINTRYSYADKTIDGQINSQTTPYTPCNEGDAVEFYGASFYWNNNPITYCVAFLADDYSFISGVPQVDGNNSTVSSTGYIRTVAPAGTAYVIASNNAPVDRYKHLHVYSYNNTLKQDTDKRSTRKAISKKIKMARHLPSNSNKRITLLHLSDIHKDTSALARIVADRKFFGGYVDDAICTGDFCANEYESQSDFASWWNASVILCIGNHDVAKYENGSYDWGYLSMADRTANYIAPFVSGWGVTQESGKSYFYKDYSTAKVRLVVLDIMLYNLSSQTDAQAQETWLANILSDAITNSNHVLIACHAPHGGAEAKECSFSKVGQGTMPTYTDCNTPQAIIDIVSTAITNGLHFAGYIVGHTHQDNMWDALDDGKQLMFCVTTANVSTVDQWKMSDQFRDKTLDAYNLVTIDTDETVVKIIRGGGADMDDKMRPRKMICFNYSTGEIVGEES